MDGARFDRLAQSLTRSLSRRGTLRSLVAVLFGAAGLQPLADDGAAARKRGGGKHRKSSGKGKKKTVGAETRGKSKSKTPGQAARAAAAESGCCRKGPCARGRGKNLSKCCFEGARLEHANFKGVNLGSANFRGAVLTHANFGGANLGNACLVDADLSEANLKGANLGGASRCRTRMPDGAIDNSDCDKPTKCCPTCIPLTESGCDLGGSCCGGATCRDNTCGCPDGTTDCDGACVDLDNDPAHCGQCGRPCEGNGPCAGTCQSGECAYPGNETACGRAARCADGVATAQGSCDGAGACAPGATTECAPYRCGADACLETCGGDDDCLGSAYCTSESRCAGDEPDGTACQHGGQCQSGFCANDVCCESACDGACKACNAQGICASLTGGSCGDGGACQDGGCVEPKPIGAACGQASECRSGHCAGGVCCDTACAGECKRCDLQGSTGTCTALNSGACGNGGTCQNGDCIEPKANGAGCTLPGECASGHCADDVCCDSACDTAATCSGGTATTRSTCDSAGVCQPGTATACDPYRCGETACLETCDDDNDCLGAAYCNGANRCVGDEADGTACQHGGQCQSGFCVDDVCCATACAAECHACNLTGTIGACAPVTGSSCGIAGTCDNGTCQEPKPNGAGCNENTECASAHCVDSVCCDTACGGECQACNLQGTGGICSPVTGGACGTNGTCENGQCIEPKANGESCNEDTECASGHCTDGVCCDTACGADCDACTLTGSVGVCSPTTGDSCGDGGTCQNGQCVEPLANGTLCQQPEQCRSEHCVDDVCCESACADDCHTCNLEGTEGACTPVTGGPCGDGGTCADGVCVVGECTPGQTRSCYSGPADTLDVGTCAAGVQTCGADSIWGSDCVGEVTPQTEICGNDIDDDCDGTVDNGCGCRDCTYELVARWGEFGSFHGQFRVPWGVAIARNGDVYVADSLNHRIQKFDSSGSFLSAWGQSDDENGSLLHPRGIALDGSGNVCVADNANDRIQKYDGDGGFLARFGSSGSGAGAFIRPEDVAVDGSGTIYVTDTNNNRVQKFDSSGGFQSQWGSLGPGDGQFISPTGIAVDNTSHVYVTDTQNGRIQKFTSDGDYVTQWGTPPGGNTSAEGHFNRPGGIATDSSGFVYVVDGADHHVQKFTSDGDFVLKMGSPANLHLFNNPRGVAVDAMGNIFVTHDHEVLKFAPVSSAPLKSTGDACAQNTECASGHCTDNVCCDTACGGECEACDLLGAEGTCSSVLGGPCGNGGACQSGQCIEPKANGEACQDPGECRTGYCVSQVCCESACVGGTCPTGSCVPAATTEFFDEAAFLAASGATLRVSYPAPVGHTTAAYTENGVTMFPAHPSDKIYGIDNYSPVLPGNELSFNYEHFDLVLAAPATALGLRFQDTFSIGVGALGIDSPFSFTFKNGATVVHTVTYNAPNDLSSFIGIIAASPFDRVEIRDINGHNDNDFFGAIFVKNVVDPKANGVACGQNNECASSYCTDAVCCDTACGGSCQACDLAGSVGICSTVTTGACSGLTVFNVHCPYYYFPEDITLTCPAGYEPDLRWSNCACGKPCISNAECRASEGEICNGGYCCVSGAVIPSAERSYYTIEYGHHDWNANPGGKYCCGTGRSAVPNADLTCD